MTQKWLDAARKYEAIAIEKIRREQHEAELKEKQKTADEERSLARGRAITQEIGDLETFMHSDEGRAAMKLLAASKRHIIFGEDAGGGYANVVFIDGSGLRQSHEPSGMWMIYADKKNIPESKITRATPKDAVHAAVYHSGKNPCEVLSWLRRKLDDIASAAQ